MNPSKLKHRIEIWGKVKKVNELKQTVYKDQKINNIWSEIIPQTGKLQKQQAETMLSNVSHKIQVRYNAGKDITKEMHIKFKGKRFDIKYILNPYFKNEKLEIFCEEVID